MSRRVEVVLEIDDRGTAKVRRFGREAEEATRKAEAAARKNFEPLSRSVSQSLDQITTRFLQFGTLVGAGLGGLAARAVLRFGRDFESTMSGVRAVSQATEVDFASLESQARELGKTTQFTAVQAGAAMEELAKAGFEATEILGVMPDVLNLAAAGTLEMAQAASITSDVMRTMGIETSRFADAADVLVKTATSAKTTVLELGLAFQDAAPVAKSLGVSFTDLSALMGTLANRGFVATRAGTALRRIFSVFLGDLEEGEAGLAKFNVSLVRNEDGTANLTRTFEDLVRAGAEANDIMEAFGLRGGPAALQIVDALGTEVEGLQEALRSAGGEAQRVAEERMANLRGRSLELSSALQEVALVVFDKIAPSLTAAATSATELVRSWGELLEGSDVFRGIERVLTGAKLAATALGVAIGVRLVARLNAATVALIEYGLQLNTVQLSTARLGSATALFASSTLAQKAGILGVAGAVGVLTFQVTRAILEITGLDTAIQNFFIRAGNLGRDATKDAVNFETAMRAAGNAVRRLDELGIQFSLGDSIDEALRKFQEIQRGPTADKPIFLETKFAFDEQGDLLPSFEKILADLQDRAILRLEAEVGPDVLRAVDTLQEIQKGVRGLDAEDLDRFMAALEETGATGTERLKQLSAALASVRGEQAKTAAKGKQHAEDLAAAVKILERSLADAGLASAEMVISVGNEFRQALAAAEQQGVAASVVVAAFRDRVLEAQAAAEAAGVSIPQSFREIADRVKEQAAVDLFFADPIERINAKLADIDMPPITGVAEAQKQLRNLAAAAEAIEQAIADADPVVQVDGRIRLQQIRDEARRVIGMLTPEQIGSIVIPASISVDPGIAGFNAGDFSIGPLKGVDDILSDIERIGRSFTALRELENVSGPVFDLGLEDLRQQLGQAADLLGPDLFSELGLGDSIALPGFDLSLYSETLSAADDMTREAAIDRAQTQVDEAVRAMEMVSEIEHSALADRIDAQRELIEAERDLQLAELEDEFAERMELHRGNAEALAQLDMDLAERRKAIRKGAADASVEIERKLIEAEKKIFKERVKNVARNAADLLGVGAEFAIGEAIVDTAKGVAKALGSYPPPANFAWAALVAAEGAVQIATIRKQKALAGAQQGGLTTGRGIFEAHETGPELILPLQSDAAAAAIRNLGLARVEDVRAIVHDAMMTESPSGGPSGAAATTVIHIQPQIQFLGDNWSESGVSADLAEAVHRSLDDLILSGRLEPFAADARRVVPTRG